jgi:hypothetical protein
LEAIHESHEEINVQRKYRILATCVGLLLLAGCQTTGDKNATATASKKVDLKNRQKLMVLDAGMPDKVTYSYLNAEAPNYTNGKEIDQVFEPALSRSAVLKACHATTARQELAPLLVPLIGWVADYLVSWASDSVQKEIDEYSKSYEAIVPTYFYAVGSGGGALRHTSVDADIRCFRYTRKAPNSTTGELEVDVIGQIAISKDRDYFQVRPLSVYLRTPIVKGKDVTLAMQLSASAVWFDQSRGRSEKIFDGAVFSEKFSESERAHAAVRYLYDKTLQDDKTKLKAALEAYDGNAAGAADPFEAWNQRPRLPLAPMSLSEIGEVKTATDDRKWTVDNKDYANSRQWVLPQIQLTSDVSEVGDVPTWLQDLSNVLKKEGSSLSKSLTSAADKALGVKTPSSGSGS